MTKSWKRLKTVDIRQLATSSEEEMIERSNMQNGENTQSDNEENGMQPLENPKFSNDHDLVASENEESEDGTQPNPTRGPTLMAYVWEMPPWRKILVEFNSVHQPVGEGGTILLRVIGRYVRKSTMASLNHPFWKAIPDSDKEVIWQSIEGKFIFDPLPKNIAKKYVLFNAAGKWRWWKNNIKNRGCDLSISVDAIFKMLNDARVDRGQFEALVQHWKSDQAHVYLILVKKKVNSIP